MLPLPQHEILVNIIIKLTSSTTTAASPLGSNGILKKELKYSFDFEKFSKGFEKIYSSKFRAPDGFLRNEMKQTSITVECKSDLDIKAKRLINQLKFYSGNKTFNEVFTSGYKYNEILIFCFDSCFDKIVNILNTNHFSANIAVWIASKTVDDKFFIKLGFGKHLDDELNEIMIKGLITDPPEGNFLISPNLSLPKLVATFGRRLLINIVNQNLTLDFFITNQNDALIPPYKIEEAIKKFLCIVPELGILEGNNIIFKKRPDIEVIRKKIEIIYNFKQRDLNLLLKNRKFSIEDMEKMRKEGSPQKTLKKFIN